MLLRLRVDRDAFGARIAASHSAAQARSADRRSGRAAGAARRPRLVGEHPAEILPVAAHADRGGADAAAEVEGEDLAFS
jgi:hypothetical protein